MGKRQATEQITREAFYDEVSDDNEERPVQATSQVLAKRKILKPRGKLGDGNGSIKKSIPQNTFQFNPAGNNAFSVSPPKADNDANKIKALNVNFINKINEANKENAIADLTSIAEKYINYYKGIKSGQNEAKPVTEAKADQSENESEEDEKKDIKIEGPRFSLTQKPTSSSSPFTFDPKKIAKLNAKDSDDSEDDVPIQGPTFKFDKPIEDNVFKLKGSAESKTDTSKPASGFKFGQQPAASTFGSSFGAKPTDTKNEKSGSTFSFQQANTGSSGSTQSFGSFSTEKSTPAFNFGAKTDQGATSNNTASAPTFNFGAKTDQGATSNKTASTTSFNFGAPSNTTTSTPSFNFGAKADQSSNTTVSTPVFNFGAKQDKGPLAGSENASNTVGATKPTDLNTTAKPFQFGASTNNGFGTSFTNLNQKSTEDSGSGSKFSFGQKVESATPTNSFGSSTSSTTNPFGGLGSTFQWGKQTETSKGEEKDEDKAEENEVEGNFAPVAQMNEKKEVHSGEENEEPKFTIRAKLMEFDASNTTNPYVNKGLGELKVLRNKDTTKSRIIMRADGSLRVLLNTLLSKDISYSSMGNGSLVRIPVFSEENKIVTYVVKVKTADDGKELLKTIEELKS